jgi:hypothetical protein
MDINTIVILAAAMIIVGIVLFTRRNGPSIGAESITALQTQLQGLTQTLTTSSAHPLKRRTASLAPQARRCSSR